MDYEKLVANTLKAIEDKASANDFTGIDSMINNAMLVNSKGNDFYIALLTCTTQYREKLPNRTRLFDFLFGKLVLSDKAKEIWALRLQR